METRAEELNTMDQIVPYRKQDLKTKLVYNRKPWRACHSPPHLSIASTWGQRGGKDSATIPV